jgi:integrase
MRPADRTFSTQTDAEVWLSVMEADIVRGNWFDPDAGRVPLGEYGERWIAERPGLSARTVTLYNGLLRLHINPTLGWYDLVDLTPTGIRSWRKELLDGGLGSVTVAKCYRLLRAVLNTAVDDELIRRNPCRIKGAEAESSPERPVATPAQVHALAAAIPVRWQALVLLAVSSSLRWGELMGLTRGDVDLPAGSVRVVRSLSDDKGRMALGPPKSAAGKRTVAIPDPVVPVLREHMQRFSESGAIGRVFVGAKGATLRRTNFQTMWRNGVEKAGLPPEFRFHDLRHTGNTLGGGEQGQPARAHGAVGP